MKLKSLLLTILICCGLLSTAQNSWSGFLNKYFRQQPIDMRFSTFISSIQKDTTFIIETYDRRTDRNFFYFSGTYKYFNPFQFAAKEVRLIVAEDEIIFTDSLKTTDTILNLQIIATLEINKVNEEAVQKEFRRFHRLYGNKFYKFNTNNIKKNEKIVAEIYSYFDFPYAISPVSVAWGILPETNECSIAITIRFKLSENQATRIISPNEF